MSADDGAEITQLCAIATDISGTNGAGIMVMAGTRLKAPCTPATRAPPIWGICSTRWAKARPSKSTAREGRCSKRISNFPLWPDGQGAIQAGARAIFAFPTHFGAVRFGALVLYRGQLGGLENEEYTDSLVMATVIAHTILALQADAPPGSVALELEIGANLHFVVHQAAGMTSVQMQIDVAEGLVRLRGYAFRTGQSVDEVSQDVVARRLRIGESSVVGSILP